MNGTNVIALVKSPVLINCRFIVFRRAPFRSIGVEGYREIAKGNLYLDNVENM